MASKAGTKLPSSIANLNISTSTWFNPGFQLTIRPKQYKSVRDYKKKQSTSWDERKQICFANRNKRAQEAEEEINFTPSSFFVKFKLISIQFNFVYVNSNFFVRRFVRALRRLRQYRRNATQPLQLQQHNNDNYQYLRYFSQSK